MHEARGPELLDIAPFMIPLPTARVTKTDFTASVVPNCLHLAMAGLSPFPRVPSRFGCRVMVVGCDCDDHLGTLLEFDLVAFFVFKSVVDP